jgi:catechol 2,3-dioxygenase
VIVVSPWAAKHLKAAAMAYHLLVWETIMELPKPVYKPAFNVTRASHLVSRVRDLAASRAFYCDLLGLVISDEDSTTLWLRGLEEACHHSLVLKLGEPGVERVGMRVLTEEDLDLLQAHFAAAGFYTRWVEVAHQGRTLHTTDPAGTPLEFCATMETRPRLFAQVDRHHGACALRLDHFQIVTPKVRDCLEFYNGMGFRLSEYVTHEGTLEMIFLQRKGNPHDIVFANRAGPQLHHVAYQVPETHHLMHVCDLFVVGDKEGQVEFGPARHFSPGLSRFLYLRDPDGHRVELFPSHYHTIDIEDEPVAWEAPAFKVGGWAVPPDPWWNETMAFVETGS